MSIRKILCVFFAALLLSGCGAKTATEEIAADSAAMSATQAELTEADVEAGTASVGEAPQLPQDGERKLIRSFDISIETKEFDTVLAAVEDQAAELGGYTENSSLDSGSDYYDDYNRYASMTIRIPSAKLDDFVETVRETANVTGISESSEDVTLQYVDVESRTKALETEQGRLLELLEKAETVEEIITIESRLSEVRYQLESYMSQLRAMDNRIDYSVVQISIREVERETQPAQEKGFWEQVADRFGNNVYEMGRGVKNFAIWFLGATPYLLVWAALIAAVLFGARAIGKKKRKRQIEQSAKLPEKDH